MRFARQMVLHHEQALRLVTLARGQDLDPDVQELVATDQVDRLAAARGTAGFQQLWLYFMTQQHRGAIPVASTEVDGGANPEAIALAREIERTQKQELGVMDRFLGP